MTPEEKAFIDRMARHTAAGLSFEDAARAVLADDRRIAAALNADAGLRSRVGSAMASTIWHGVRAEDHRRRADRAWVGR